MLILLNVLFLSRSEESVDRFSSVFSVVCAQDVLILSQFLRADGCLLPRRVTGVCWGQQQRLKMLVNKAQRAGLYMCSQCTRACAHTHTQTGRHTRMHTH